MWYKNAGTTVFRFVTNHAFDRRTDRRTDRIRVARPRLHSMQRGKSQFHSEVGRFI